MKKMMKILQVTTLTVFPFLLKAQNAAEVFVGDKGVAFELLSSNDLDTAHKWNLFTIARFETKYKKDNPSSPDFYTINPLLTYGFTKNFGLSAGGHYEFGKFIPQVGVNVTYFNKKGLFLNVFPTVSIEDKPNLELFGIINYSPRISDNWKIYSQIIVVSNFNTKEHNISNQLIRLGLDYKSFQFGIGGNIKEFSSQWLYSGNYGVFFRKNFSIY